MSVKIVHYIVSEWS